MKTLLIMAIIALIAGIVTGNTDILIVCSVITSAAITVASIENTLERLKQKP